MTVADRIKIRRNELNLSQAELAKKANYSDKTAISKLENAGNDITMKQLRRIAIALDTTVEYLMGWDNETDIQMIDVKTKELVRLFNEAPKDIQEAVLTLLKYRS